MSTCFRTRSAPLLAALAALVALAALLAACSAPSSNNNDSGPPCPTDTAGIQQQILVPRCATAGCHVDPNAQLGLDFSAPDLERRLVNVPAVSCAGQILVAPGNPDGSFLFHKVSDESPQCGARMPQGGDPLSADQIACLRQWISGLSPLDAGPGTDAGLDASLDGAPDASTDNDAPCPAGQTRCNGTCVDPQTDNANCGACGNACSGGASCSAGQCAGCPAGTTLCGGSCVDTNTDTAHCGGCATACQPGQSCTNGACTCGPGRTLCNGACVDTLTDASNCGGCNQACVTGQSCTNGTCSCGGGLTLCNCSRSRLMRARDAISHRLREGTAPSVEISPARIRS